MAEVVDPGFRATVPDLIHRFTARFGDAEAIVRDGQRRTFRELNEQSAQVAKALLALGAGKAARIGVLAPPGPEFVVAVLAACRIGAVVVPLSTLYQAPELAWVAINAELQHLIVADRFRNHDYLTRLEEALPGLVESPALPLLLDAAPRLRSIHVIGHGSRSWSRPFAELTEGSGVISDAMLQGVEALVAPSDPVCIIYTSGSTAEPKGVIHGHGPLIRHSWQMGTQFCPFGEGDRLITTRAMFWVAGFVATLFYGLQNGACLITTDDGSPANVVRLAESEHATGLRGDSGWFDVLRDSAELNAAGLDVIRLNMDGAAFARDGRFLSDRLDQRIGRPVHHPSARFARTFGMTETLGGHTTLRPEDLLPEERPSWQGRPLPGVEFRIVDPHSRQPLPPGSVGELLVRGYCLMQGINGRERDETFDTEGFYATGDLCQADADGLLKFESRLGEMIKVHGANVAPLEVELAMTGLLGIEKAAVVGLDAEGDTTVVAAVLMAPGRELDEAEVRRQLGKLLSSFKVPKRIVALRDAELPQTGSGKVRKNLLKPILEQLLAGG